MEPVTLSVKVCENVVFEDMKQEDENYRRGGAGNPLGEYAGFEDMKQEDEKGWSR